MARLTFFVILSICIAAGTCLDPKSFVEDILKKLDKPTALDGKIDVTFIHSLRTGYRTISTKDAKFRDITQIVVDNATLEEDEHHGAKAIRAILRLPSYTITGQATLSIDDKVVINQVPFTATSTEPFQIRALIKYTPFLLRGTPQNLAIVEELEPLTPARHKVYLEDNCAPHYRECRELQTYLEGIVKGRLIGAILRETQKILNN